MTAVKEEGISEHPANFLSKRVDEDVKKQLLMTPPGLLIENPAYKDVLQRIRSNFKFCYIIQWLYLMKHLIRLSDAFDVENFEEELTGIADPPVFLNSFKTKLIQYLGNYKMKSVHNEFASEVARFFIKEEKKEQIANGDGTENSKSKSETPPNEWTDYDTLDLDGKIDILYQLVQKANEKSPDHFRKTVMKYEDSADDMRIIPILETTNDNGEREEYFMLKDARLYYRKWEFKRMEVPVSKREFEEQLSGELIEDYYSDFEPKLVSWKCLTAGIYEFDKYVQEMRDKAGRNRRCLEYKLGVKLNGCYEQVIDHDLRKRKQALHRKREVKMQYLLAHRKRSSRIVEMEQKKKERERRRKEEEERQKQEAAERRLERRRRMKERQYALAEAKAREREQEKLEARTLATVTVRSRSRSRTRTRSGVSYPIQQNVTVKSEKHGGGRGRKRKRVDDTKVGKHEKWQFDCLCGVKQKNYDDGKKMIGCEKCKRWQHYECQSEKIRKSIDEDSNYKFTCSYCRKEAKEKAERKREKHMKVIERHAEKEIAELEAEFARNEKFQTSSFDYKLGKPIAPYSFEKAQTMLQLTIPEAGKQRNDALKSELPNTKIEVQEHKFVNDGIKSSNTLTDSQVEGQGLSRSEVKKSMEVEKLNQQD